jgi:hypothetical protein
VAYPALELGQEGNEKCPDEHTAKATDVSTLECRGSDRFILQVSTNAVMVQLGQMPQGGKGRGNVLWQDPKPFQPCMAALYRRFDAIRVWNYTKGLEAQVMIAVDSS